MLEVSVDNKKKIIARAKARRIWPSHLLNKKLLASIALVVVVAGWGEVQSQLYCPNITSMSNSLFIS